MRNIHFQLTKNFNLSEFVVSKDYPQIAKEIKLTDTDICKFFLLCAFILQPLRDFLRIPITILSGKRNDRLNLLVKGVRTSIHLMKNLFDCAADFWCKDLWDAFQFIKENLIYGELIIYLSPNKEPEFIHVSLPNEKKYKQAMVKDKGKYINWDEWIKNNPVFN